MSIVILPILRLLENELTLLFVSGVFTNNDVNKFKSIVTFDCRGVEPVDFEPKSGWIAEAEDNGTVQYYNRNFSFFT